MQKRFDAFKNLPQKGLKVVVKSVFYLKRVMRPAGMNFPELANLSPITTVRVPEVPAIEKKQLKQCRV